MDLTPLPILIMRSISFNFADVFYAAVKDNCSAFSSHHFTKQPKVINQQISKVDECNDCLILWIRLRDLKIRLDFNKSIHYDKADDNV
jgi:hypothetical protein